jgi:hypothetical protein
MSQQYRQLAPFALSLLRLGAIASSFWLWAGLRLTSRGFMAA